MRSGPISPVPPAEPGAPRSRRAWLAGLAGCLAPWPAVQAHNDAGRVQPPQPAPSWACTDTRGRRTTLPALLAGRTTALQVMFTSCSATCPIQGALFQALQSELTGVGASQPRGTASPGNAWWQLVSVTIDPLGDDLPRMRAWLTKHGAGNQWLGLIPEVRDVDRWFDFLRARTAGADNHTAQVYLFDRQGRLVLRSTDFPKPVGIALAMRELAGLR
jgi:protein SCO1